MILFQHFPVETDENHNISHSIQLISMPWIKPKTPEYKAVDSDSLMNNV